MERCKICFFFQEMPPGILRCWIPLNISLKSFLYGFLGISSSDSSSTLFCKFILEFSNNFCWDSCRNCFRYTPRTIFRNSSVDFSRNFIWNITRHFFRGWLHIQMATKMTAQCLSLKPSRTRPETTYFQYAGIS